MEGTVAPTSILGMDTDLPLAADIKEEIVDPAEILPDVLSTASTIEDTTQPGASSETVESPTTGDGSSGSNVWNSKCVFCERLPTASDEPKLLECLHSACSACINGQCEQNQANVDNPPDPLIMCKVCDMPSAKSQIIENQFLIELTGAEDTVTDTADKNATIKCSSCSDEAIATSWCVDCQEYICDNCVQAHQRLKITKDHTIKPKDDGGQDSSTSASSSVPKSMYCSMHSHERLSLFCVTCDELTCRDCQLKEHREHKYKFIHEIAEETRASMALLLKDVSYKRVLLSSAMGVIDDRQKLIQDKKNSLVKEITQMVVRLTNTINVRGKQLVMRLNEVCDAKQKTLNEKREALDQLSMLTDHCVSFTQHALDRGSDMALLHSKRHVLAHLNRIKSRRADIPNPEIPVRIHLALDKVPDLIKVVSSIGAIVVDGKIYPSTNTSNNATGPIPHQSPSPQALPAVSPQNQMNQMNGPPQGPPTPQGNVPIQSLSQVFGQPRVAPQTMMQRPPHSIPNQRTPPTILPRPPYHPGQQQQQQIPQQAPAQVVIRLPGTNNQQVTSSTHPQGMAAGPDSLNQNLRGLLQTTPGGTILQTAPPGYLNNNQQAAFAQQQNPQNVYRLNTQQPIQQQQYRQPPPSYTNFQQPQMPQRPQLKFNTNPQQIQGYYQQQMHPQQGPPQQSPNSQQQQQHRMMLANQQMMANAMGAVRQIQQRGPSPMMNQGITYNPQQQSQQIQYMQQRPQQQPTVVHPQQQQPQQQQQQQQSPVPQSAAQWHIPQQAMNGGTMNQQPYGNANDSQHHYTNKPNNTTTKPDDSFKITLKNLAPRPSPDIGAKAGTVSSTIPKTPSPNATQNKHDEAQRKLDKFCQDSVNDLMATIAKLDSNGVQVLAESRNKGGSPHVDSSTDNNRNGSATSERRASVPSSLIKNPMAEVEKDDPNEDWCAVCMDGGELVCCDKCPKVFHQYCHIPNLSVEESDTWQCLLCMNFADIPNTPVGEKREPGLTPREKKIAERIVLELYCQYEPSLPFRELVGPENTDYHAKIKKPMALDVIRQKLDWNSPGHYTEIVQLISDLRLMFRNAYNYNEKGTQVYNDAQRLEEFLDQQLEKWLPAYAYEDPLRDEEDKLYPPLKRYRRILSE